MPFVGLSDGQFCMGSAEGVGSDDEHPRHPVKVSGFLLGRSEVTQAQWRTVVRAAKAAKDVDAAGLKEHPSYRKGDRLPVESVSWCDAIRFANALSRLDGYTPVYEIKPVDRKPGDCRARWVEGANGYRLPTEAEWEYAARAGTTTAYATGDDEAALARVGWYGAARAKKGGNSGGKTNEVCTRPVKPWGLCDLHGNVWEWVFDVAYQNAYSGRGSGLTSDARPLMFDSSAILAAPFRTDKTGALSEPRVFRGGSQHHGPELARSASRNWDKPSSSYFDLGFRLLLPSP
jgi:formylglycine-generating enzyme required for sulfatase activity